MNDDYYSRQSIADSERAAAWCFAGMVLMAAIGLVVRVVQWALA